MQTNILWSGIEYYSLENCMVDSKSDGVLIDSAIVGLYKDKLYRVEYTLELSNNWETYSCIVKCQVDDQIKKFQFKKKSGKWSVNGKPCPEFDDCTDVDIPLTPLTNSLPINRLCLKENQEQEINVIYIDLLEHRIKRVSQKYKKISHDVYHYENIPNDFEAELKVDAAGFVVHYPQLFERKLSIPSNYRP